MEMENNEKLTKEEERVLKKLEDILENEEIGEELIDLVYNSHRKVSEFFEKRNARITRNQELQTQL